MNISIFKNMTSKLPLPGLLEGVANLIRSEEHLKAFTDHYRQTGNKQFKLECPLFAVAVLFEGGKGQENIKQLTGLSLVDFDHIIESYTNSLANNSHTDSTNITDLKAKIIADPHTLMCYTTISGNGLRVIYKYELPKEAELQDANHRSSFYQQAFFAGNAYYEQLLGIKADGQCKNVTRLSGLAHDPDVFLRPEAEAVAFTTEEIAKAAAAYTRQSKEDKQMQRIQTYYDTLIAPQLAKDGIKFEPGNHNKYVMRVGYKIAERRFNKKVAIQWAKKIFAAYNDTEQVFNSCYANANQKKKEGKEKIDHRTASVDEIKAFLDGHVQLRYNEITSRVEYQEGSSWLPITDRKVNSLWAEMSLATRVNRQDFFTIIDSDYVPSFNPFKDYFEQLMEHTDVEEVMKRDPIQLLADTVKVTGGEEEQARWSLYLKKWLVAMVGSWLSDDCINDVILVLIGEQGAYKTTWCNRLLPPLLRKYFYTKTNANRMSKDDLLTLAQYALVCCEELDTMRPSELNQLKAVVTMPSIDERAAYAHYHEHRQHIASFCGTGNNPQFLSDPTGNRRWLPFEVESIVSPREHPFDYEGIFAQAYHLYQSGYRYWFTKEEIIELNQHNHQFEAPRLERELVNTYFRKPAKDESGVFMTVARAIQIIGIYISQKLSAIHVGRAFTELGFQRKRLHKERGYLVEIRTSEEIAQFERRQALDAEDD